MDQLKQTPGVQCANLSGQAINIIDACAIAVHIAASTELVELDISNTGMSHNAIHVVVDAVAASKSLYYLNLDGNNIGDRGAEHLAAVLAVNDSVQWVYLNDTNIGDEGASRLIEAMRTNKKLTSVFVGGNHMSHELEEDIHTISMRNTYFTDNRPSPLCRVDALESVSCHGPSDAN